MVLHAELAGQASTAGEHSLLQRLPYAYRLELERRDATARSASLAALRLLAKGVQRLQGVPLDVSRLHVPEGGKAFLDDGPCFSISHSARRAAVAISEHGDLGLDIEDLDAHGMDPTRLERWTAIEATLKLVGAGLRRAHEVQLSPDLGIARLGDLVVHTRSLQIAPDCVARLATREPVRNVVIERIADSG